MYLSKYLDQPEAEKPKAPEEQTTAGFIGDRLARGAVKYGVMPVAGMMQIAGDVTGIEPLAKLGKEGGEGAEMFLADREKVHASQKFQDIDSVGTAGKWAAEQLTEFVPQAGLMAVTGGLGGAAGKLGAGALIDSGIATGAQIAGKSAVKAATTNLGRALTLEEAGTLAASRLGTLGAQAANTAGSIGMETSTIYQAQKDGEKDAGKTALYGVAAGILDSAVPNYLLQKTGVTKLLPGLGSTAKEAAELTGTSALTLGQRAKDVAKIAGAAIPAETTQEGIQTILERIGSDQQVQSDEARKNGFWNTVSSKGIKAAVHHDAWDDIIESMAAGGLIGGVMGGGASVAGHAVDALAQDGQRQSALNAEVSQQQQQVPVQSGLQNPAAPPVGQDTGVVATSSPAPVAPAVARDAAPVNMGEIPEFGNQSVPAQVAPVSSGPLGTALAAGGIGKTAEQVAGQQVWQHHPVDDLLRNQLVQWSNQAVTPEDQAAKQAITDNWDNIEALWQISGKDRNKAVFDYKVRKPQAVAGAESADLLQTIGKPSVVPDNQYSQFAAQPFANAPKQELVAGPGAAAGAVDAPDSVFSGAMAADYLLTGGFGVMLSTEYLLQAYSGLFQKSSAKVEQIRKKYVQEIRDRGLDNVTDFVKSDLFAKITSEMQAAVAEDHGNSAAVADIFNEVAKYPTGMSPKVGNAISKKIEEVEAAPVAEVPPSPAAAGGVDQQASVRDTEKHRKFLKRMLSQAKTPKAQETARKALQRFEEKNKVTVPALNEENKQVLGKPAVISDLTKHTSSPVKLITVYGDTVYVDKGEYEGGTKELLRTYTAKGVRIKDTKKDIIHRENLVSVDDAIKLAEVQKTKRLRALEKKAEKNALSEDEFEEAKRLYVELYVDNQLQQGGEQAGGQSVSAEPAAPRKIDKARQKHLARLKQQMQAAKEPKARKALQNKIARMQELTGAQEVVSQDAPQFKGAAEYPRHPAMLTVDEEVRVSGKQLQAIADYYGSGEIHRLTERDRFETGTDRGNPEYGHKFSYQKEPVRGITSFAINADDDIISVKDEAASGNGILYAVRPDDLPGYTNGSFVVVRKSDNSLFVYANQGVDTSKATVILHGMALKSRAAEIAKAKEQEVHNVDNLTAEELAEVAASLGFTEDFSESARDVSGEIQEGSSSQVAPRNAAKHKAFLQRVLKNAKNDKARASVQKGLARLESRSKPIPTTIDEEINSMSLDEMAALFSQAAAEAVAPAPVRNRAKMQEALRKKLARQLAKSRDAREQKRLQQSLEKLQALQAKLKAEYQPAEQADKPEKDNGPESYFKKGDRVQFASGVHGEVVSVDSYTITSAKIGFDRAGMYTHDKKDETHHTYQVRKDNGVKVSSWFSEMFKETDPAPEVVPAPVWGKFAVDPDDLLIQIENSKKRSEASRAAAGRAKKKESIKKHNSDADVEFKAAFDMQAAFDAWAEKYPEEAAKYAPAVKPVATPAPAAAGTGIEGLKVTFNAVQNGIELRFAGKLDDATLAKIKANGFRWAMGKKIWYAKDTPARRTFVEGLQGKQQAKVEVEVEDKQVIHRKDYQRIAQDKTWRDALFAFWNVSISRAERIELSEKLGIGVPVNDFGDKVARYWPDLNEDERDRVKEYLGATTEEKFKIGDYVQAIKDKDLFKNGPYRINHIDSNGNIKLEGKGNAHWLKEHFVKSQASVTEEKTIWNDDGTNGPVAITAPPSDYVQLENWWNKELTLEGRRQIAAAMKGKTEQIAKTSWGHLNQSAQQYLKDRIYGTANDPAAPPSTRSAADILGAAAKSGVKGADEALKGLYELFGGKSLKSFPGAVDEDTYRAAKPHFTAALENFRAAGKSLKEFFSFLIDQFGAGIQPYVMKYMQEKQQESGILKVTNQEAAINDDTTDGGTGKGSLESSLPGIVSATEGQGGTGQGSRSGSQPDTDGNENLDAGGSNRTGSLGIKPESVHLQPGEGAEGSAVLPSGATGSVSTPSEPRTPKLSGDNPGNYRITAADELGGGTRGDKINNNLAAIRLVKQLDKEGRYPTRAEQAVLVKYVGWGGLKSVFDPNSSKPQDQKARTELERLLTDAEYFEARQSVLNAHYTSPEIIGSIYSILQHMGFKGGNVLEPTYGSGNFIGLMPEQMAAASKWYGSELDPVTSKIGKFLYPDAQLLESGFQDAEFPYGKFDLAIGNPPFGAEQITDTNKKRAEIDRFKIHNYVIAKSGMHLRPGGVMAMVVTSRFMDTANPEARDYLAQQFKFLTAIRLPNDAFAKNAGTEVTTDLVFFQKLMPGEEITGQADWLNTDGSMTNAAGESINLNAWFAKRPSLMLGEPSMKGTMYGGQWRKEDGKGEFTLNARPGQDTAAEIETLLQGELFEKLQNTFTPTPAKADAAATSIQMNREDIGIGGYVEENGEIFMREDDDQYGNPVFIKLTADTPWTEKQTLGETRLNRIKGMLDLRKAAYALIEAERFDLSDMEAKRKELNRLYDTFVSKHGFLSDSANASLMADDVKIESGLEVNYRKAITAAKAKTMGVKPQPAKADKAAIMQQRVFFPTKEITSAANARDGYGISLSEKGRLDLAYIAGLTGQTTDEVVKELAGEGLIFKDPATGTWKQEDEYLSGNVKAKLAKALGREGLEKNVEALTAVLPKDVTPEEIFADLGATWIPAEVYKEFADLLGVTNANVVVIPETGTVKIISGNHVQNDMNVMLQNPDHDVASLINHIAAKQAVVAYDFIDDKRVVNKDRTKALAPMVKRVSATFRDWLMADPRRAAELTKLYNDTMNTHAPRTYNGKHLKTVGASPAVRLRNSQRNAAWRMLQSPVVLLDHVVGAGKTFTIITGVMERRRLGLSNKSMIVVPNHLVGQWGADFLKLYPGARILATTEKDFAKANRKRLFARIATGNYDAVIVGHSSFGFIPLEAETQQEFVMEEISYLERALSIAQSAGGNDKRLIRNLTEKIAKKRERIRSLMNKERDDVITFENMGVDNLVVDESHEFKNLEYSTSMQNITGMGNPNGAKKSFDLYAKIQYLRGKDGAITFATGTPISNSLVEMYTILRYLNRQGLKDRNLDVFDAWAKAYASIESRIEYTASQKLKDRQVMATFNNLPELLQLYSEFADVIGMKDLKRIYAEQIKESNQATGATEREEFPIPKVKSGARYLDVADPTSSQRQYMDYLVARANRLERLGGQNDPKTDNHLWLMNDARKMALDIRLVDPSAPSDPDNKVSRAAGNIKRIYDQWHADKGAQLVFCDLSTPAGSSRSEAAKFIKAGMAVLGLDKDKALANTLKDLSYGEQWTYLKSRIERRLEALSESETVTEADEDLREKLEKYLDEVDDNDIAALQTLDTGFSVYDDLKATLINMGIPASEIRFIHEANTNPQKQELFNMVNSGLVRVLIGSSRKMGAGTNAQERLVALHHMDAPWRPSDVEQREGRIIRQGNVLYERDPDTFEVEIPAYSTRNTFDSVSWQILARKAEMLEDFRSGARSMQDSESDAASYSEFMAESTGNPAFREKFKLEREIEELESTERNISARRAAGERIVKNADADIAKAEKTLQSALRDMAEVKDAKIFEVDGKKYADDLTEAYNKAYAEYETAYKEYSTKLLPEYVTARAEVEHQDLTDKEQKEALKLIKKPAEPAKPTLPRLEKSSQAARAALRVSELLDDVAERGEVEFAFGGSQVVIEKVPVGAEYFNFKTFINGKERWGLSANGLKHMSQQKLMELFNTGEIASRVAADLRVARAAVESVKQSIEDAERTLSKLKFEDADKLKSLQDRYKAVVEEVNQLEKDLDAKREQEANIYLSGDSRRFGGAAFSLSSSKPSGLKAEEIQRAFAHLPYNSKIKVVQTALDLPGVTEAQLSQLKGKPNGMHKHGTIWLVADNLYSVEQAKAIALGHELTHAGQNKLITDHAVSWFEALQKKDQSQRGEFQQLAWRTLKHEAAKRNYDLNTKDGFRNAVKEATAVLAELAYKSGNIKNSLFTRLLMVVKHILRTKLKLDLKFTDQELVQVIGEMMRLGDKNMSLGNGPDGGQFAAAWHGSPADAARDKQLLNHFRQMKPQKLGSQVATMVSDLVDLLESVIPPKLKANLGKILSNPWFGSEGSVVRRAIVRLNLQRSHVRNELIHNLMAANPNAGYSGTEGLDNILKDATPEEVKAWNALIKKGDIQEVQYADKELKAMGYSDKVIAAYQAFHAIVQETNRVRFEKLKEISLLPYKNKSWFDELKGLLDYRDKLAVGLDEKEDKILSKLLMSIKKLSRAELESIKNPTGKHVPLVVIDAYLKFIKQLNSTSEPGLVRMAFRHITEYSGEIDKIRNEWRQVKGYAPRVRKDGDWHVSVYVQGEDEDGNPTRTKVFMQPTITEFGAQKLVDKIKGDLAGHLKDNHDPDAEYQVEYGRNTATPGELLADKGKELALEALVNNAFEKAGIFKTKDVDVAAMKRSIMKELSKEIMAQGFSRHGIAREKHLIEGYQDADYQTVLKEFISGMSGWLSKMQYAVEVMREADTFSQSNPDDKVWIHSYYKDSMKNSTYLDEVAATARSVGAVWYLGFKVSSAVINAFQNYTVGQAELARLMKQGGKKGEAALLLVMAQKDVLTKKNMTAEELQVLDKAIRQGTLHAQTIRSMSGLNEQGFGSKWKKFTEKAMTPFSWVEQHVNREPAMLAAYRVFKTTKANEFDQAAFDKAEEFVNSTHYVMGNENLPELVRMLGPIGKTAYLFQGYVHNYLLWLAKRGRNGEFEAIARSFGAIALLGGVFALPGADDMDKWIEKWFGVSYKMKFKKFIKQNVGKYGTPGELLEGFINHGLPSVAGVDMSRALAVNVPFVSDPDKSFGDRVGGVWSGMLKKPGMALSAAGSGDYYRAIESLMPEFVANPMRAVRQYSQGATTLAGKPIFDETGHQMKYGAADVARKALGFNPMGVSERTELKGHERAMQIFWKDKRDDVLAEYRKARTTQEVHQAGAAAMRFNRDLNKSDAAGLVSVITADTLRKSRQYKPDKKKLSWERNQLAV